MKKLLLIFIVLFSFLEAKPIHHRANDWFHEKGFVDRWTWTHAGIGGVKGLTANLYMAVANRYGYDTPSAIEFMKYNLYLALAWEMIEYLPFQSFKDYNEFYGGFALENNSMDVIVDMLVFSVPLWDNIYYEIKILKHEGFSLNVGWNV